jgi:hypothetical protein
MQREASGKRSPFKLREVSVDVGRSLHNVCHERLEDFEVFFKDLVLSLKEERLPPQLKGVASQLIIPLFKVVEYFVLFAAPFLPRNAVSGAEVIFG